MKNKKKKEKEKVKRNKINKNKYMIGKHTKMLTVPILEGWAFFTFSCVSNLPAKTIFLI